MNLTEAGRVFYDRCLDIAASVERAEKSVETQGAAPRGTLKVTAQPSLGRRVVAPLILDGITQAVESGASKRGAAVAVVPEHVAGSSCQSAAPLVRT